MRVEQQLYLGPDPLLTKIIDIGDWDMLATPSVSIAHGLALADIRHVYATIRQDDDLLHNPLERAVSDGGTDGYIERDGTNIGLYRRTGGLFVNTNYDLTPFNRGWIVIQYVG